MEPPTPSCWRRNGRFAPGPFELNLARLSGDSVNVAIEVLWCGALAGLVHFVAIAILYGNPIVDRIDRAVGEHPAMKQWPSKPKYFGTQFLGTQVEVYIFTIAFFWLRPRIGVDGYAGRFFLER